MKLKIKITGPKVHEVGYRYFLMSNAIDMGLKGFHAASALLIALMVNAAKYLYSSLVSGPVWPELQ
jgi:hypothetical protein